METNRTPLYDHSVNTTGCCPRFNPEGWDRQTLHFDEKPFVRATTRSLAHVPLNMGKVFARVIANIEAADGYDMDQFLVMSHDTSAFAGEHLFAVRKPVEGEEMTTLSGDFVTRVFEGPFSHMRRWETEMTEAVRAEGREPAQTWFFYTTCPKCAKAYGKNHVVGMAELA